MISSLPDHAPFSRIVVASLFEWLGMVVHFEQSRS